MDNVVDKLNEAIKLYVTKLTRGSLDERDGKRAMEIISFAINLEHIGDIIDKNLCELAAKKIKRRMQFSPEGAEELKAFHKRIVDSLCIALQRVHVRRCERGAQADRGEGGDAQRRARGGGAALRTVARGPARRRSRPPRSTSTCCAT